MVATQEKKKISTVPSRELCPTRQRTRTATCVGSIKRIFFYAIGFCCWYFHPRDFTDSHQMSQHFNCEFLKQGGRKVTSLKSNRGLEKPPFEGRKRIR